ncbi:MAG: hypothetical protein IJS65_06875 [Clostridia bacterium]|nr:hypothetical protein [Clostridia bacterium]
MNDSIDNKLDNKDEQNNIESDTQKKDNKRRSKKVGIIVGIAIIALIVLSALCIMLAENANITKPLNVIKKYSNAEYIVAEKLVDDFLNGIDGGKLSDIVKIMKKSDDMDTEIFDKYYKYYRPNNYYVVEKVIENSAEVKKEKIDNDILQWREEGIRDIGESYVDLAEYLAALSTEDRLDLAEDLGLKLKDVKDMSQCLKTVGKKLRRAKVSSGYLFSLEESNREIELFKVNGKWINVEAIAILQNIYREISYAIR